MIRRVLLFPDPMLKRICEPVDASRAARVAADLIDTMRAAPGCVGLAAPQIGEPVRVAVVDVSGHRLRTSGNGLIVMIGASIEAIEGESVAREGCLSLPDITADVGRSSRLILTPQPGAAQIWCDTFEARAVQHELDHLDGILILDRVKSVAAIRPRVNAASAIRSPSMNPE